MKLKHFFRTFMFATLICGVAASVSSCKDDDPIVPATGSITGTVSDANGNLAGVTITVSGDADKTATSAADGTYTVSAVNAGSYTVVFSKSGYTSVTKQITSADFTDDVATVNATLVEAVDAAFQISGTVSDSESNPLKDVAVVVTDEDGEEVGTATTAQNGSYIVGIDVEEAAAYSVTFSKEGYTDATEEVAAADFNADGVATVNATLEEAAACQITGTVYDENEEPLEGATVSVSETQSVTTDAEGVFTIDELEKKDYTVTIKAAGYKSQKIEVEAADFDADGVATVDDINMVVLGDPLRGQTAEELANAPKLPYNWYLGGNNGGNGGQWDWSTNGSLYAAMPVYGRFEAQSEGLSIRISDPAPAATDLDVFNSYAYFSKKIVAGANDILTVTMRTHDAVNPTVWGVQVVDLSEGEPEAVKIVSNEDKTEVQTANASYSNYYFDLSEYAGKEVIVAIGTYYHEVTGANVQLVLRSVLFAPSQFTGVASGWPEFGTEITGLEGWRISQEYITSTMVQTESVFTGITGSNYNNGNFWTGYSTLREKITDGSAAAAYHIIHGWAHVPVSKDAEPMVNEGMIIKTANTTESETPHAYIYAKFDITAENCMMNIIGRTFDNSNVTRNKITVIKESDFTFEHLQPSSHNYPSTQNQQAPAVSTDGSFTWRFNNGNSIASCATLKFDLSEYVGQTVVVAIGVYASTSGNENKICFRRIELSAE